MIFWAALLLAAPVWADTCEPKRLRGPTLEMERVQADSQTCYAFATAHLLSWELGIPVSAADISMFYNDRVDFRLSRNWSHSGLTLATIPDPKRPGETVGGGRMDVAINVLIDRGVCTEADMPSGPYLVNRGQGTGEEVRLGAMLIQLEELKASWDQSPDCERLPRDLVTAREIFPDIDRSGLIDALIASTSLDFTSKLQARNCARHKVPIPPGIHAQRFVGEGKDKATSTVRKINAVLDGGRPIGLATDARFVGLPQKDGFHATTIIGRRPNAMSGQCEYLFLDSAAKQPCPTDLYTCDADGNRWAPEALIKNTFEGIYYIEKTGTSPPDAPLEPPPKRKN